MSKSKDDEILIEKVIKDKFGDDESKHDPEKVMKYLEKLYSALSDIFEDNEEEDDEDKPKLDHEMVGKVDRDDGPEGFIPYVIVKKENETGDVICPHCKFENKLFIKTFDKQQYKDYDCPNCHKISLVKLEFEPKMKMYLESKSDAEH